MLRVLNQDAKRGQGTMGSRTIVVGDIHGCYDELEDMLAAVEFGPADRLVSVGDLITKGPKSREVLERFMSEPQFSAVIGNHDLALRRRWNGEKFKLKDSQRPTHKQLKKEKEKYLPYLNSLPFMIDLGTHLVVHAGVRPGVALHSQTTEDLTELRSLGPDRTARDGTPWYEEYDGEKVVLFGHWPAPEWRRGKKAIGLDTGCVYGNKLTAYIIETGEFKTVPAHQVYDPA
jgi:predicted phosphodiesterase